MASDDTPRDATRGHEAGAAGPTEPTAAEQVIAAFGGIRPMAAKLDVPVTTVQGWKKRGAIPETRHTEIAEAAHRHGIDFDPALLAAAAGPDEAPAPAEETAAEASPEPAPEASAPATGDTAAGPPQTGAAVRPSGSPANRATARPHPPGATARQDAAPARGPGAVPPQPQPAAAPHARPGGASGIAWAGLVFALLAIAAAITQPFWGPVFLGEPRGADLADRIAALEAGEGLQGDAEALAALTERMTAVEQQLQQALDAAAASEAMADRLAALEEEQVETEGALQSIDMLRQRLMQVEESAGAPSEPVAALTARVDDLAAEVAALSDLTARVDTLEAGRAELVGRLEEVAASARRSSAAAGRDQALVLAVGQLRDAVASGTPFGETLAAIRSVAGDDADIAEPLDALAPMAATGVPGLAELASAFPEVAAKVRAAVPAGQETGWLDRMRRSVEGLVSVRPAAGEVRGDGVDATLARAQSRLDAGRLAGAVEAMSQLQGPPAEAAAGWLRDARDRLAATAAVRTLGNLAVARLGPSAGAGAGAGADPAATSDGAGQ